MLNKTILFSFLLLISFKTVSGSTQQLPPLYSGDGWRVIRSIELGNTGKYIHMVLDRYSRGWTHFINDLAREE